MPSCAQREKSHLWALQMVTASFRVPHVNRWNTIMNAFSFDIPFTSAPAKDRTAAACRHTGTAMDLGNDGMTLVGRRAP